ncbi:MAG: hypothetical protein IJN53_04800 [Oscillospiraceae bacterium]|nr:hypothetical protein [Oscillospiraceae bacterium]
MNFEGKSGYFLKLGATTLFVLCLLSIGISGVIGIILALKVNFLLAIAVMVALCFFLFPIYLICLAIYNIGQNAENISAMLDLVKSTADKVNEMTSNPQ